MTSPERSAVEPRGGRALLVVVLVAAIYVGYARSLDGELQFDDLRLTGGPELRLILSSGRVLELMRTPIRALTNLSLGLNYRTTGLAVRPFHLVNLGLHLATVLAVLALVLRLLRRVSWPWPFATALLTAAVFGLHPIQTEAVSYIYQRSEVQASLFYVLGLLLALVAEDRTRRASAAAYAGALACLALGWGSKPIVATLPAALVLCGLAFPRGKKLAAVVLRSLPFWALAALFGSMLMTGLQGSKEAGFAVPVMSARQYILTQPRVILTYLRLLFWPSGQNVDWQFPVSTSLLEPRTALAFAAIGGLLCGAAWLWWYSSRRARDPEVRSLSRLTAFGILWSFLLLSPTSSFVPIIDVIAEHRLYLPSLGIFLPCAAAGVLLVHKLAPGRRGALAGCAAGVVVCLALAFALYRRNSVWESALALWTDTVAKSPGKARPHMNLGYALVQSDPERALAELKISRSLAVAGDPGVRLSELDQNVAGVLLSLRRYPEAIALLEQVAARQESAPVLTNLAIACLETGQLARARAMLARVLERWPLHAPAHHTLGQIELLEHQNTKALLDFRRAVELDPDSAASLASLAMTQQRLGDSTGACASWDKYAHSGAPGVEQNAERLMATLHCAPR